MIFNVLVYSNAGVTLAVGKKHAMDIYLLKSSLFNVPNRGVKRCSKSLKSTQLILVLLLLVFVGLYLLLTSPKLAKSIPKEFTNNEYLQKLRAVLKPTPHDENSNKKWIEAIKDRTKNQVVSSKNTTARPKRIGKAKPQEVTSIISIRFQRFILGSIGFIQGTHSLAT